jgi:hypothetical protein
LRAPRIENDVMSRNRAGESAGKLETLHPQGTPYLEMWQSLTPAERLRRAWRLRKRLPDLQAAHDAKTDPGP